MRGMADQFDGSSGTVLGLGSVDQEFVRCRSQLGRGGEAYAARCTSQEDPRHDSS
jgi:hypothetical protein